MGIKGDFGEEKEKVSKFFIKERNKIKKQRRHAAANLVSNIPGIKEENYTNLLYAISEIILEDIEKCCISLNYQIRDFGQIYAQVVQYTIDSILKVQQNLEFYKKEQKYKSTLYFLSETDTFKKTKWFFQRLVSNIRNSYDERYKSLYFNFTGYTDFKFVKTDNELDKILNEIENEQRLKELKKLDKDKLNKLLRIAWKRLKTDMEVDNTDFVNFCRKFDVDGKKIIAEEGDIKFGKTKTKGGHNQLCWQF